MMSEIKTPSELKLLLVAATTCTVTGASAAALVLAAHTQWAEPLFYIFTALGMFLSFCSGFYILFTHAATGLWPGEKRNR